MNKKLIAAGLILGLVVGGLAAEYISSEKTQSAGYCDTLEANIAQNKTFEGTVDCFDPEEVETDLPDRVNDSATLKCVCRKSYNGSVSWMNIAVSN
ncbi:hypothetical protein [Candidatus Nanohalovita haloferacivicina]|uniref:hypothetical protein n=1 Tax=Candidatus Nanohalovita haloferacivicina TaxID=2978046 RepID=UPI00325FA7C6|nr:hypothetical protein HBNXNv_0182 [Candidatus Nanohalobia archaeon BNXNv]